MKTIRGDLIALAQQGEFDLIVHGCNCHCAMGEGIAKTVKSVFPEAFEADVQTPKGSYEKLGTCSVAECKTATGSVIVVNAYTQYHWHGEGVLADYAAISSCLAWIKREYPNYKIGLPKLGAGLAGGDWEVIFQIISAELAGEDVTIVEYWKSH